MATSVEKLVPDFEQLKVSAFTKYSKLTGDIHNVTIGPNSTVLRSSSPTTEPRKSKSKNKKKNKVRFADETDQEPTQIPVTHVLRELESQRREKVRVSINDRLNKFKSFSKTQNEEAESQWLHKQQRFIEGVQENEQQILQALAQPDANQSKQNEKLVKHYQEMIQRKMQCEQQLEQTREKQRILGEKVDKIKKFQAEFKAEYQEIFTIIKTCASNEDLKNSLGEAFKLLNALPKNFDAIISKCKTYTVDQEHLSEAAKICLQINSLKRHIEKVVTEINTRKEEQAKAAAQAQNLPSTVLKIPEARTTITSFTQCVSATNLKRFAEIKQFLSQHSEVFKELLNDEQLKQFRFDCKKAVNIPVNAISAVSSEHLREKYVKLSNLLSGKTVLVADKQINASRHPQGVPFCMDLLAKKFVLQGDLMISSNPDAAFCYATIIVSLWNDFPDFGKLLLGYFYAQCPYLVPFYMPRTEDQTDEEYYMSLGYYYVDGQIEKQDKFLKRMTGILRLYFAITIAKPKRGQAKNPHGVTNAWNFLASIMKLDPQLDITATAIHIFLETVGFEMEAVYGRAFKRVMKILVEGFVPLLKRLDAGGPVTRLEVLLQDYRVKGRFEKPNGVLEANFW